MGLAVALVSGPPRSGKSSVIRAMVAAASKIKPHYIRLVYGDQPPVLGAPVSPELGDGFASTRLLAYTPDRVYETLPAALTTIHRKDRFGFVIVEAEADPVLRCAYEYNRRVFVMPVPSSIHVVFRTPHEAARELRKVLDDTESFASEIFGMLRGSAPEDTSHGEPRPNMSDSVMRGFLYSPLGDELATRIQLQPQYHGLVESDVIVVNSVVGKVTPDSDACLRMIEKLLTRLAGACGQRGELFCCDPRDLTSRGGKRLLKSLGPLCTGGT